MSDSPHLLVLDGYSKAGRDDLAAGGATTAGELYRRMLQRCCPNAAIDMLYPADPGVSLPDGVAIANYHGIAWTGSSLTVYHDSDEVRQQIDFAREVFKAGVPSFGSCWATQIAVVAAGGHCHAHPRGREMGIARKISLTPEGLAHPMYRGKKRVFDAFISHDDEVTNLPHGGLVLAGNDFTRVQAVSITFQGGHFWSPQYHPEYDLHELARLCYCRKQKLVDKGFFTDLDAAQSYVDQLETLFHDPTRKDIAWLLGIDDDIVNPDIRQAEVRNWIELSVMPGLYR
jgi:GMP synthase (glutamine-hydrolysing)